MDRAAAYASLERFCAERIGPDAARALMRLARPALAMTPSEGRPSGHERFGGAPMLTPGTPWPYSDEYPMSLVAVVDTDTPWLDGSGLDPLEQVTLYDARLPDLREQPGVAGTDVLAFGWPDYPTGGSMSFELGADPTAFRHLLQLQGEREFTIGGEGGVMHWSIPAAALADGDFTAAIPTPDLH